MAREALVEEREVGAEQIERAAVLVEVRLEEEIGFLLKGLAEIVFEVGKGIGVRRVRAQVPDVEPLAGEVADEGAGARIREHPTDLPLDAGGRLQLSLFRGLQQRIVRDAAPQEEGEARGQLDVADSVRRRGRNPLRILFDPEDELRAHENAPERELDSRIEAGRRRVRGV